MSYCLFHFKYFLSKISDLPGQGEFVSDIPAEDGKIDNLLYSVDR